MAISISAKKRIRQNEKRRIRNKSYKSMVKNLSKKIEEAITSQNKEEALAAFEVFKKTIDSVAGKGILHKNTVARKKSRLSKKINAL